MEFTNRIGRINDRIDKRFKITIFDLMGLFLGILNCLKVHLLQHPLLLQALRDVSEESTFSSSALQLTAMA